VRGSGTRTREKRSKQPAVCRVCGKALVSGPESARGRCATCPSSYDEALFERLKAWRKDESSRQSVPAYVVFTDATLEQVATLLPGDTRALLAVQGDGARKLEAYGDAVLARLRG
jgi:DNA helicase-2/ATP-dependent DNA helicase PcrA